MDKSSIHARIGELERELADVKQAAGVAPPRGPLRSLPGFTRFVVSHWVLLSFVATLFIAAYVKETYGIDYFESYRQQATQRKVAEVHRRLGDRLMAYTEWKAAEHAYRQALEADPNNEASTHGLLKATVFAPDAGQEFVADDVVNARLQFISESFGDDYFVCFLKGFRSQIRGDFEESERAYRLSIDLNPLFVGGHLQLGYVLQGAYDAEKRETRVDLAGAADCFNEALRLDGESGLAHNNVGYCLFLQRKFAEAAKHLERANALSPSLITLVNLGDVRRSMGDFPIASLWHQLAYESAEQPGIEKERFVGGGWKFNHLPIDDGDGDRVRTIAELNDFDTKRSLVAFHLALDRALLGQFDEAERLFGEGMQRGAFWRIRGLLINRIDVIVRLEGLAPATRRWFVQKQQALMA